MKVRNPDTILKDRDDRDMFFTVVVAETFFVTRTPARWPYPALEVSCGAVSKKMLDLRFWGFQDSLVSVYNLFNMSPERFVVPGLRAPDFSILQR